MKVVQMLTDMKARPHTLQPALSSSYGRPPRPDRNNVLVKYAVAVVCVFAGLLLRLAVAPLIGAKAPYITFFPAVIFTAWFGGLRPGLLGAALSLLAVDYYLIPPFHSFRIADPGDVAAAVAFAGVSVFITILNEQLRRAGARTEERVQALAIEHFHLVLDAIEDYALLMLDADGHIISWNMGAQRMKGYQASEIVGQHFSCFYLQEAIEQGHPAEELRIAAEQGRYREEGWRVRKDGSRFVADVVITPVRDSVGKLRGFTKVVRDVTQREEAAKKLRDQALILDLANDTIFIRDAEDRITYWNQGAQRLYGWSKEEVLGQVTHTLLKTQFPESLESIQEKLSVKGHWRGELVHTRRDGSLITVASAWTRRHDSNQAAWVLEMNYDITARKEVERHMAERTAQLQAANKELETFAYVASHDLKAPLRVIDNACRWLEEDLQKHLTAETQEHMDLLRGRVRRMDKLLDDLLEYARIGKATDARYAETTSGDQLMDDVLALLPLSNFRISISSRFADIRLCRMPLQQILTNLIGNAIKHHDKKTGSIEVTVEDKGEWYAFAVKDDGPGIPARFHDQIFQMFQTLKPRDQVEGSGMGLAMVRKNIEVFSGTLHLESSEGRGSNFHFTWPKRQTMGKGA